MQEKIKRFFRSNALWLVVTQALIIFVALVNKFPEGFVFSGADILQYFNFTKIIPALSYTWTEGIFLQFFAQNLYYVPLWVISTILHLSPSTQSIFYYVVFLSGSFWSFFYSTSFYLTGEQKMSVRHRIVFSVVYTFNLYTFYNFYYTWGYSPFLFLYVVIPVIFGASYRFFSAKEGIDYRALSVLGVFFFISNIANGNLPFFISLNIFLALFVALVFCVGSPRVKAVAYFKRLVIYYAVFFFAVCYSVLPQVREMINIIRYFKNTQSFFDLKSWLLWQAVRFPHPFFLVNDITQYVEKISPLFLFSLALFVFIIILLIFNKHRGQKILPVYFVLLLAALFLLNKGVGIIGEDTTLKIFGNTLLSSLRSSDKILVFFPFFLVTIAFLLFQGNAQAKKNRYFLCGYLIASFISVYPFFIGGIQTKYSLAFNTRKHENYTNAQYAYIHKIPDEYYRLAGWINEKQEQSVIFNTPYNVMNSLGWVNYTKWQVVGVDLTTQIFNKQIITMNTPFLSFGTFNYGGVWGQQSLEASRWIYPFARFLNAQYFVYHRDVDPSYIAQTEAKVKYAEKNKLLLPIDKNDYFDVYKIADAFFFPILYTPQDALVTKEDIKALPALLSGDKHLPSSIYFSYQNPNKDSALEAVSSYVSSGAPVVEFKKINPVKYRVRIHGAVGRFPLILSDSFNPDWKVYVANHAATSGAHNTDQQLSLDAMRSTYKTLDGNQDDQASVEDVEKGMENGWISTVGDGGVKEITHTKWENNVQKETYREQYRIAFISKNRHGSIQNNNLPPGSVFETWFQKPVVSNEDHLMVNGYANSWFLDTEAICQTSGACKKNENGTKDIELMVEFWPQRLYYAGLVISGLTFFLGLGLLTVMRLKKKERTADESIYE